MLTWLVTAALRLRVLVVFLAAALLVLGIREARRMPVDVFPEFAHPLVEVQTEAPGLSTEEVESLVTVPLENALSGVPYLEVLRSKSVLGLSSVQMLFAEGTDLLRARQIVQERIATEAGRLPAVALPPVLLSPLSSTSRALKIGVSSKTLSQMDLTVLARFTLRPRFMAVPGVANVAIWGQRDRQFQVLVDPDRLRALAVPLDAVVRAAGDAATVSAGGFLDTPAQRLPVRHLSPVLEPEDLGRTVVAFRDGAPLRLSDVARVVVGPPPPIGDAVVNGGPGLLLIVEKQPWGNTLEVTHKVEEALRALRPGLKDVEVDAGIFRPATFIERSIDNLNRALLLGCALVIAILFLFLRDVRSALISLSAIPLSLLAAALLMRALGGTMNTMVLAGLVIAVGEVVDDAIIDVENIGRRLRSGLADAPSAFDVVLAASLEVRSAVVYASLIVVLVFLPVFFLGGVAGSFFRPLGLAYTLSILASLLVALTLTPALSLLLLPRAGEEKHTRLHIWLVGRYRRLLPRLLMRPRLIGMAAGGACVLCAALLPFLGEEFLPEFQETDFLMHWVERPGASLEAVRRATVQVSKELLAVPGVRSFGAHIGRAEVADEVVGPNFAELWISVDPGGDYQRTVARIQEVVDGYPGLYRDVLTYLKERIKEVLTGASAAIVVRIYGPDQEVLRERAQEVARALTGVPGIVDLKVEPQVLVPQVEVRVRPEAAARFGLTAGQVRRAAATLVRGQKVGEVYEGQRAFAIVVWGDEVVRGDLHALRRLGIEAPGGAQVPLGEVADVQIAPAPNEIKRERASRRIDVSCNVRGSDLGSVAREIERRVLGLSFPRGYHPEFLGEYQARRESQARLLVLSVISLLGILLLLWLDFRSLRLALLCFCTLPFALCGGVIGALLCGGVLSLGSLIGFVSVLGIAARNGIMLISHYQHLLLHEGETFGPALFLRGAAERLRPILMTTLCAGLALLPILIGGKVSGHEIEHPMAAVILGGLLTSAALNLLVLPALYAWLARPPAVPPCPIAAPSPAQGGGAPGAA